MEGSRTCWLVLLLAASAIWATPTSPPALAPDETSSCAELALQGGLQAMAQGRLIDARNSLCAAYFSDALSPARRKAAASALATLAQKTILSSRLYEKDPFCFAYVVRSGDTLSRISRTLGLQVPADQLAAINGIDPADLKVGQTIKLVRGPFLAVINKGRFDMDLLLQQDSQRVLIRCIPVCVGKNDKTPEGLFRIARKVHKPSWKALPDSKYKGIINYGEKGYPFGKKALWLGLEGIDDRTRGLSGFALHTTNEQSSIGKARSHGCVRIGDADIDLVYGLLQETTSTVEIRR